MNFFNFRTAVVLAFLLTFGLSASAQNKGFDVTRMDDTTNACTDFFQYANGTWLKETEIPASESRWGTFNILADNNRDILKEVLENAAKTKAPKGSDTYLIGSFYNSCMDEAAIEKAGINPVKPHFKQIDKIKTAQDLKREIAVLHNLGVPVVFRFGGGPDLKNSSMVIANASQGGLSLPNRDYYTKDDAKSKEIREKFVAYMTNMFKLLGDSPDQAAANAKTVMEIEMRLANASLPPVELRNPDNRYHKMSLADAQKLSENFNWQEYMSARGVPVVTELNIGQPAFFEELNKMLADVPVADWKTYFRWTVIDNAAPFLSKAFVDENFDFYSRYLSGTQEQQPRWRRCVQGTDGNLGEALGQEFVKKAFTPEAKKRMDELINNLFAAMKERINNLDWMSPDTKKQAQTKLSTFKRKIGYPDVLRGYKGLEIQSDSYFKNVMNSNQFQLKRNLADIGQPLDRNRWGMTPPTVNAYYTPILNEIVFPAGILQPPFFNFEADDAINYGAIGGVIGHEISHGFDDQGSRFDAEGNLKMWWTDEDRAKFEERASCVVKQFDGYEVQDGLFINGKLTLGENIGDFAGLNIAYDAFMKSLEGKPHPAEIDGFTPEQRFFLGWAQVWAGKYRPEAERQQVKGNSHSLPRWRVNGPLSNMPQFAKAFGCKAGDPMVRADMCKIW
ncbi:MAG: M13 family metallopeptidase [Pyrinomonadaceae bacterium]